MRSNIAVGVVCLGLAAVFGVQMRVTDPIAAIYPIVVLSVIALVGLVLVATGILRRAPDEPEEGPRPSWRLFLLALAVLLAWSVTVSLIGFAISGTICFVAVAWLVRKGKLTAKTVGVDVLVAAVTVVACAVLFTRVLGVPLPVSAVLGL